MQKCMHVLHFACTSTCMTGVPSAYSMPPQKKTLKNVTETVHNLFITCFIPDYQLFNVKLYYITKLAEKNLNFKHFFFCVFTDTWII